MFRTTSGDYIWFSGASNNPYCTAHLSTTSSGEQRCVSFSSLFRCGSCSIDITLVVVVVLVIVVIVVLVVVVIYVVVMNIFSFFRDNSYTAVARIPMSCCFRQTNRGGK